LSQGKIKIITIAMFLIFICLPQVQTSLDPFSLRNVQENRKKAQFPEFSIASILKPGSDYFEAFTTFFNDNYGLRDFFIRLKNQLDYSLFNSSDRIILGADGYLFHRFVIEDVQVALERTDAEKLDILYHRFLDLNAELKARGVKLIILFAPQKNAVYPEKLPHNVPRRPQRPRSIEMIERLSSSPDLTVVNTLPLLVGLKEKFPTYFKTDLHWNPLAAYHVGREIVTLISEDSGIQVEWSHPFVVETRDWQGDQARFLAKNTF
jgi:hypothetical protein